MKISFDRPTPLLKIFFMNLRNFLCVLALCVLSLRPFPAMGGAENPIVPMGAIVGKPDAKTIRSALKGLKEAGITQYMIYPRSGFGFGYMSGEWLDACENICAIAEELGFTSVWLYDEFNWPSGTANKTVMAENPNFAYRHLDVAKSRGGKFEIVMRENPNMSNLLDPAAVECFMRLTHEKYAQKLAPYLGTLVKGIFTDEPSAGYFSPKSGADLVRIPYYDGLEEDYKKLAGSDLRSDMLLGARTSSAPYEAAVNRLVADRFSKVFAKKISDWCAERGMVLTGHLMDEYFSSRALRQNGHPLKVLQEFSLPGIDDIFTPDDLKGVEWLTYGTGMYAIEKRGNKGGAAELFAIGPTDMPYEKLRRQIWLAACFGADRYFMLAPLDARGNAIKKLYYTAFTPAQPWFGYMRELGEDAKLAASFATKERKRPLVEVRYPYKPANLTELLKNLSADQYSWRLLAPEDAPSSPVVLNLEGDQIRDEITGKSFWDYPMLKERLLSKFGRSLRMEDAGGNLLNDVFVREYADGSAVILSYSQKPRTVFAARNGARVPVALQSRGVEILPGWKVEIDSPNFARAEFENGEFAFEVSEDMDAEILLAEIPEKAVAELDGAEISADKPCAALTPGLRELYGQKSVRLKKGRHTLKIKNPSSDNPYLPAAIIAGNFSQSGPKLYPYKDDGAGLIGYAGGITQTAEMKIPEWAVLLKADTGGLPAELFIGGKSMGRRAWPPFAWRIPQELAGKRAEIKIRRETSNAGIFGTKAFEVSGAHDWLKERRPLGNSKPITPAAECVFE